MTADRDDGTSIISIGSLLGHVLFGSTFLPNAVYLNTKHDVSMTVFIEIYL